MSVDYYVVVPAAQWPSAEALQVCIDKHGYPVRISLPESLRKKPLAAVPDTIGLPVEFRGEPLELEFGAAPDESMTPADKNEIASSLNSELKGLGITDLRVKPGDYVASFAFQSDAKEYRSGAFVMAALIQCFGGYGFESQGGTHGREGFAKALATNASDDKAWK